MRELSLKEYVERLVNNLRESAEKNATYREKLIKNLQTLEKISLYPDSCLKCRDDKDSENGFGLYKAYYEFDMKTNNQVLKSLLSILIVLPMHYKGYFKVELHDRDRKIKEVIKICDGENREIKDKIENHILDYINVFNE